MKTVSTETFSSKLLEEQFIMFLDKNLLKINVRQKIPNISQVFTNLKITKPEFPHVFRGALCKITEP